MRNIVLFACLPLLLLCHQLSFAQSQEYLKGYMITTTQDTIHGYIKDDRRINLLEQFSFKSAQDESAKTVSNSEAVTFHFEPSFYFDLINVGTADAPEQKFLQQLVDGYVDLYQYPNGEFIDYVLIRENGEQLLIAKRDVQTDIRYKADKRYFGQLKYFFRDCSDIAANTKSINYDEKTLKSLIKKYNRCVRPDEQGIEMDSKRKLNIEVGIATNYHFYDIETLINQPPKVPTEDQGRVLQFGGMLSLSYFNKLSLKTGILYSKYTSDAENNFSLGVRKFTHAIETLEFPIYLKYELTNTKIAPYLIGGMRVATALNANSSEIQIAVTEDILFDETYELTFTRILGYSIGAGINTKLRKSNLDLALTYGALEMTFGVEVDVIVSGLALNGSFYF
ncbi:MAG: hypothetical protein AAGG68_30345 [Bacteroidota bacterium]